MPKFMVTLTISPSSEGTAHHRHECKPVHKMGLQQNATFPIPKE